MKHIYTLCLIICCMSCAEQTQLEEPPIVESYDYDVYADALSAQDMISSNLFSITAPSIRHYNCTVTKVYDADTYTGVVELGLDVYMQIVIRSADINAYEVRGEHRDCGIEARDFCRRMFLGKTVRLLSAYPAQYGKYGRLIAWIEYRYGDEWININDELVSLGYAHYIEY